MTDEELEQIIGELVRRKKATKIDSAEYNFLERVLNGLRYKYEEAGPIWEGLDPFGWDATHP